MKRLTFLLIISSVLALFFISESCNNAPKKQNPVDLQGNISISGAFAMYPLTVKWAEEFKKLHPKVSIDVSAGGAGKGMADVLNGLVDVAMFSREVSQEEINKGAWFVAVAKDAVLPTINTENPAYKAIMKRGLTKQEFTDIFLNEKITKWKQLAPTTASEKINVYTRSDACGAGEMWAKFMGKKQEDLKGIGVYGDPGMSDAVKKDKNGVGYNNVIYAYDPKTKKNYDGIGVIPLDLNGNGKIDENENFYANLDSLMAAIKEDRFPSPPARNLYFITKGKTENALVLEFFRFVLNQGQQFIHEAGYVTLNDDKLKAETEKLNK
ncbi:MAG: substrate-binding domain-containing protein [Bacteroidota bacterium]